MKHLFIACIFSTFFFNCSDDTSSKTNDLAIDTGLDLVESDLSTDHTTSDNATENIDSSSSDANKQCSYSNFSIDTQSAEYDSGYDLLYYTAKSPININFDALTVDFYFTLGATKGPSSYISQGESLAQCHTCIILRKGCTTSGCDNAKTFMIQSGELAVSQLDISGSFSAELKNAVFAEVTINLGTQDSTLVENGETWCIESLALASMVTSF